MTGATGRRPETIDARGPRWVGGFTFVLAVAALFLSLLHSSSGSVAERAAAPEFVLFVVLGVSFALGVAFGNGAHPFAVVYRHLIRPRLSGPAPQEDARPPRFALVVGLAVSVAGAVLQLAGVPFALAAAAGILVVASALQAFAGVCLGCQVFVLLVRVGVVRLRRPLTVA